MKDSSTCSIEKQHTYQTHPPAWNFREQTSIRASRFLSSSSSFLLTAEESMLSPVALDGSVLNDDLTSFTCDSMLLIFDYMEKKLYHFHQYKNNGLTNYSGQEF